MNQIVWHIGHSVREGTGKLHGTRATCDLRPVSPCVRVGPWRLPAFCVGGSDGPSQWASERAVRVSNSVVGRTFVREASEVGDWWGGRGGYLLDCTGPWTVNCNDRPSQVVLSRLGEVWMAQRWCRQSLVGTLRV